MKRSILSLCFLAAVGFATTQYAQGQTPTELIAECINDAWAVNSACQTDDSWLNDLGCAIKFEADLILCTTVLV
jgi:hypothetical protein